MGTECYASDKDKVHPRTGHEGPDGGEWSTPRPGHLTTGKETRYPLYRRLGGRQGQSGRMQKISSPPGSNPRTVQPVVSRYTGYAIPAYLRK
jgi:hypothetical protein